MNGRRARKVPKKLNFESYEQWAATIKPELREVLEGKRQIPLQQPFVEAWLGYALYYYDRVLSLEEVIESADAINHGIPNVEELAWAFLCLRKRGWLAVEGDKYGLSAEGRRAINTIVVQGSLERLKDWVTSNPPTGQVTAKDVFLSVRKKGS